MPLLTRVVVDPSDPLDASLCTNSFAVAVQMPPQSLILELEGLCEFTVPIYAPEVSLLPRCLLFGDVVALVADPLELWWTHCVHPFVSKFSDL